MRRPRNSVLPLLGFASFTIVSSVETRAMLAVSNLERPIAGARAGDFVLGGNRELAVRFDTAPGATLYSPRT